MLEKTYNLDSETGNNFNHGAPILLSSVNNWILTRFLDVKIFAQLLKSEHDQFAKKSIIKRQKEIKDFYDKE